MNASPKSFTQRVHGIRSREYTTTVMLGGVELEIDYTHDEGCLFIDTIRAPRDGDITGLIDWLDENSQLTNLMENDWERR